MASTASTGTQNHPICRANRPLAPAARRLPCRRSWVRVPSHALTLGDGDPVPLSGEHNLSLSVMQQYVLHIGPAAGLRFKPLQGAHVPTSRIALEEVLRMAIVELGARPRRKDWQQVFERTQAGYEDWRTWPATRHSD